METDQYILITVILSGLIAWITRVAPFVIFRKYTIPDKVMNYLNYVPIAILAGLLFENFFVPHAGHLTGLNILNIISAIPALITAILTKNLLLVIIVGVVSYALLNLII